MSRLEDDRVGGFGDPWWPHPDVADLNGVMELAPGVAPAIRHVLGGRHHPVGQVGSRLVDAKEAGVANPATTRDLFESTGEGLKQYGDRLLRALGGNLDLPAGERRINHR